MPNENNKQSGQKEPFFRYGKFLQNKFGAKVQKISINAGFSCPNIDGLISTKGCIYCDNNGFKPQYCSSEIPIKQQIDEGIRFFERKKNYLYLAYFQSYTNTHATPTNLRTVLQQALQHERIIGIIVSTRPDCVSEPILDVLREVSDIKPLMIEFGVESTCNATLQLLNRGHSYEQSCEAIVNCHKAGIEVGIHLILGLPGESQEQIINHATAISKLPINSVKLHQLQIVNGTQLAQIYLANPDFVHLIDLDDYVELCCDFVECLRSDIAIERFASMIPLDMLAVSNWKGIKNHHITHLVQNRLLERGSVQGKNLQL